MIKIAVLNSENTVINFVSVSDDDTSWEESSTRKEFRDDGSFFRKQNAKIGGSYDPIADEFVDAKPYPSWTLDSDNDWNAPVAKPSDDKLYFWNEGTTSWDELVSEV